MVIKTWGVYVLVARSLRTTFASSRSGYVHM